MFHLRDGFFFQRTDDGSVRIVKTQGKSPADAPGEIVADITVPENEWASVVSSVCKRGETGQTWSEAREYHSKDA